MKMAPAMNGNSYGHGVDDDYDMPPRTGIDPRGQVVVDSYRGDIVNGFEKEPPALNPVCYQDKSLPFDYFPVSKILTL